MAGQASDAQPCSVMSGQTPVAMSWSTARSSSTATPWRSMIARLLSISPWVWLGSGERFKVQFTYRARRSSKRQVSLPVLAGSVIEPPWSDRGWLSPAGSKQHLDQQRLADQQPDHHRCPDPPGQELAD